MEPDVGKASRWITLRTLRVLQWYRVRAALGPCRLATRSEDSMPVIRYLVNDVDAALPFYRALGFKLADRWGPPFAIVKRKGLSLWLSGPGTSARKNLKNGAMPQPGAGIAS